jgi:hypothetical protein
VEVEGTMQICNLELKLKPKVINILMDPQLDDGVRVCMRRSECKPSARPLGPTAA